MAENPATPLKRFSPVNPRFPHMLHGGDYNPDQWLDRPDILAEDMRLMRLAHCNAMSVGIFAWTALEPEEGRFEFGWLDKVMDDLAANGACAVLATPSGARPAWLSQKYPEVLRVQPSRVRNLHGIRHNHCFTSPVYREKVALINERLAERYHAHPALAVWHLSNEYSGECHCPLCQEAFRDWLKQRYQGDLDKLNKAWWAAFWSHTYTDWAQVESPAPHGESYVHCQNLDWKRFTTAQTVDFMRHEIAAIRKHSADTPVTTNLMGFYTGLDYWKLAPHLDVVSWDSYPCWHHHDEISRDPWTNVRWDGAAGDGELAAFVAMSHDLNRSMKQGRPFMLMESTPSMTNWQSYAKLKRPGMHILASLQAVAHGSDTVQYFQWRKSRGSSEKFHGAVVDHAGHEHTRVFREVAELGQILETLAPVTGTGVAAQAAVIYDWENRWAMDDAQGPRKDDSRICLGECAHHHRALWQLGVGVDVIDSGESFDKYRLLVAPMLYMLKPGVAERIERFVEEGGVFVATYWSGIVNESDLCFLGGFPGPLRKTLGVWAEELDALAPAEERLVEMRENTLGLAGAYPARFFCDLIHAETARVAAVYIEDFYAGRPALTENTLGKGGAWYMAARMDDRFLSDFYGALVEKAQLCRPPVAEIPPGVDVSVRSGDGENFLFVLNFNPADVEVPLQPGTQASVLAGAEPDGGTLRLGAHGYSVLKF